MKGMTQLYRCCGLLAILLAASGCEETLPTYVEPEYAFSAEIIVEDPLEFPDDGGSIGPFSIDIWNLTGGASGTSQFVLEPPFEISASITIALTGQPSRNKQVSDKFTFDAVDDYFGPGERIRIYLDFPPEDEDGHAWNYDGLGETEYGLTFGGTVTIESPDQVPAVDLEMHPPIRRITLKYVTPSPP
jgi:hypothetical protein